MTIYYTGHTALDFWRWHAATLSAMEHPHPIRRPRLNETPAISAEALAGCAHFASPERDVEVVVGSKKLAHRARGVNYQTCILQLPPFSFHRLNRDMYVASPEFLFVSLAKTHSFEELLMIGCELCGTYVISDSSKREIAKCDPLTSSNSIRRMARNAKGIAGAKTAAKAAVHLFDNAASPMESCVALTLCLPNKYGGYGLPRPDLNAPLQLTQATQLEIKRNAIIADMLWANSKVAIEYESTAWHRGDEKFIQDSVRRNDMRSMGYDVTTITLNEYNDITRMNHIAKTTARKLGKRLDFSRLDPTRQLQLRSRLKHALANL